MKEQLPESTTKRVVDFEDSLLRLHRERFFLRACIFVSISIMAVLYRLLPLRCVIVGGEIFVIVVLWIWAAINAKKESQVYNEYVKSISPSNAQQLGLKPAPIRGFFSFFIKSWDVTCFFSPFLFFLGILLVSPSRNLDGCVSADKDLDKCIEANRLYRVNYISERSVRRLHSVQAWAGNVYKRIKECALNREALPICDGKEREQMDSESNDGVRLRK